MWYDIQPELVHFAYDSILHKHTHLSFMQYLQQNIIFHTIYGI